jgi:hypothetical protein
VWSIQEAREILSSWRSLLKVDSEGCESVRSSHTILLTSTRPLDVTFTITDMERPFHLELGIEPRPVEFESWREIEEGIGTSINPSPLRKRRESHEQLPDNFSIFALPGMSILCKGS